MKDKWFKQPDQKLTEAEFDARVLPFHDYSYDRVNVATQCLLVDRSIYSWIAPATNRTIY